jgi:hypothetical protein
MLHAPGLVKALIEAPLEELWKSFVAEGHEEHSFHIDPKEVLMNGFTVAPAADGLINGLNKYGVTNPAFWVDQLLPNVAKQLFMESSNPESMGDNLPERIARTMTSQPKADMKEETTEAFENRQNKRQTRTSNKYMNRLKPIWED